MPGEGTRCPVAGDTHEYELPDMHLGTIYGSSGRTSAPNTQVISPAPQMTFLENKSFSESGSRVLQAGLKLTKQLRMTLNF